VRMAILRRRRGQASPGVATRHAGVRAPRILLAACWVALVGQAVSPANAATRPVILPIVDATDIRFNHVFSGKGPSHSRAHRIVQDEQGFLWFATQDRLQRYDGYDVREYAANSGNPNDPNLFIRSMVTGKSGKLWLARDQGIGIAGTPFGSLDEYDPATGIFTPHRPDTPLKGPVIDITQDRDGWLWLATNQGLIRMDAVSGRTSRFQHSPDDPGSLSGNLVRSTFEEKDGTFWVATTKGLDRFDRRTAKVVQRIPVPEDIPTERGGLAVSLCEDRFGFLWAIFSFGFGLAQVDRQAGTLTFYSLDGTGTDNTIQGGARAIQEDRDGTLWIGTPYSGILKLDRDRKRFVRYRNNPADPESIGGDQVLALAADREGNIWAGTNDAGVDRFAGRLPPFKRYRHEPGNPNSLDTNYTSAVYEDSHGILWVGSRRALGALDRKTGRMTFYRKSGAPGELSSPWVISIVEDHSGYLWFGTRGAGLNRLDRRTGRFKTYRHDPANPHSLSHDMVTRLFVDRNGVLWAGTDKGIDAFDPVTGSFETYIASGLSDMRVRDIAEDAQGALWIATRATGLLRMDPLTRQFTIYRHTAGAGSLSRDQTWAVCADRTGIIWIGTQGTGLNRFDPATGGFTTYSESDGLANNSVSHILEDERGDLWVSTHNGLSRFNPREKTFRNYYASDGLAGNEFYDDSFGGWKSPDGEIFLSSDGGVTSFFPRDVVDDPYVPPVVITDLKVFGNSLPVGGKSPLKKAISLTNTVTLSHTQNVISLAFSALSYTKPESNRYRYRLESLETKWNESEGNQRFITYALSPGEYTFRVQGSNSRSNWNEKGATLHVVVLPPWWRTWWFRSLMMAFVLAMLGFAYYLHLQNLKWQFHMRLEERVSERTRIARELHDTLLQSFHGLLLRFQSAYNLLPARPADARQRLGDAIDQAAQAITEGRDAVEELRSSPKVTHDLASAIDALGQELAADAPGPVFHVEVEGALRDLPPILRDEIYRIAGEAIRNAFRHARAGRIDAGIRYGESQLQLKIRDDGKGIDPKVLDQKGCAGHWGLQGMHERAKNMGGDLDVWSEVNSGTEVDLSIPAAIAYATHPPRRRLPWYFKKREKNS
jgi:signal transduction histidine kinase/ligand-binding sensor domain-containing protein